MKKGLIFGVSVLSLCLIVTGCGKKNENPLVGKWAQGSFVFTFNKDKTCSYDAMGTIMKCTYEIEGDKLSILYTGDTEPFETTFKIKDKKLTIKDSFDSDVVYTKK